MVWRPNVTVAAVIEQDRRFLLVEEETEYGIRFNQPAGHLEPGEALIDAVKREVLEETAWRFEPEYLVAIQLWRKSPDSPSFLRVCFSGRCHSHDSSLRLDEGIIAAHWLTLDQIRAEPARLRSPLVIASIDEYLNGQRHPLSLLKSYIDPNHE